MAQLAMLGVHEHALAFNDLGPKKVRLAAYEIPWKVFQNCLGICMFVPHGREQTIETVNAVTGWNTNLFEVMKAGERALAMARVFNVRAGFTPADDRQPPRFAEPLGSGAHEGSYVAEELMDEAVALYYEMMGWERESGAPTTSKLYELGLNWLVEEAVA
jgi:aldehyde:ferredoxin oxidoreductase